MYLALSGCYMFQLVAILREVITKYFKTHINKLVLTVLCM